jgi:hypothetical protein
MQGKAFLDVACELVAGSTEAHWRAAAGRAYYALLLEGREALRRWGVAAPRQENVHIAVRRRFLYAGPADLRTISDTLDQLSQLRSRADYNLSALREFATDGEAQLAIQKSADALALLDAIDADPARRTAAVAAIRAAFP